jgi:hypothetical protein
MGVWEVTLYLGLTDFAEAGSRPGSTIEVTTASTIRPT